MFFIKNKGSILLIEDDQIDAKTVERALKDLKIEDTLVHVENGEEALAYLKNKNTPNPAIILLDLNMPKMSGLEFLKIAKNDTEICSIPVIILTTSKEEHDLKNSFDLSVAGYMVKPIEYDVFVEKMGTILSYWATSELPG